MAKKTVTFVTKNKAQLDRDMNKFGDQIKNVVFTLLDSKFEEMVNYAKENAVWVDRTGNARRSIAKEDFSNGDVAKFYLVIGVDYGIWLEIANAGKYAILEPTADVFEPQIMEMFRKVGIQLTGNVKFTILTGF